MPAPSPTLLQAPLPHEPATAPLPAPAVADLGLFAPERPGPPPRATGTDLVRYEPPVRSGEIEPYRGRRGAHRAPAGRRRLMAVLGAVAAAAATAGVVTLGLKAFEDGSRPIEVAPDPTNSTLDLLPDDDAASESPSKDGKSGKPSASASGKPSGSPSQSPAKGDATRPAGGQPGGATSAPGSTQPAPPPPSSPAGSTSAPPASPPTLSRGDSGAEVVELQKRLDQLNLLTGSVTGEYEGNTVRAVTRYQQARGITSDATGVYGPATRASLESETSEP
ncbi:peptidoglycan-binding domain-containing protein [Streptomyces sp. NPDC051940]|uniref:peptidoglycan-binding domain-containing protein n=1 Tax=Streptomyces sp. NPDC051940 TaxID=3155675 RepID=UPI0034187DD7